MPRVLIDQNGNIVYPVFVYDDTQHSQLNVLKVLDTIVFKSLDAKGGRNV